MESNVSRRITAGVQAVVPKVIQRDNWFGRNKTKVVGVLLIALGSLQANASFMQSVLSPKQFSWFMVGAGVLVAVLGFLNNPPTGDEP